MEREFRLDYPLPMTSLYVEALNIATRVVYGGLAPIIGDNAILVEFAALYVCACACSARHERTCTVYGTSPQRCEQTSKR